MINRLFIDLKFATFKKLHEQIITSTYYPQIGDALTSIVNDIIKYEGLYEEITECVQIERKTLQGLHDRIVDRVWDVSRILKEINSTENRIELLLSFDQKRRNAFPLDNQSLINVEKVECPACDEKLIIFLGQQITVKWEEDDNDENEDDNDEEEDDNDEEEDDNEEDDNEKRFICEVHGCNKIFISDYYLNAHRTRIHSNLSTDKEQDIKIAIEISKNDEWDVTYNKAIEDSINDWQEEIKSNAELILSSNETNKTNNEFIDELDELEYSTENNESEFTENNDSEFTENNDSEFTEDLDSELENSTENTQDTSEYLITRGKQLEVLSQICKGNQELFRVEKCDTCGCFVKYSSGYKYEECGCDMDFECEDLNNLNSYNKKVHNLVEVCNKLGVGVDENKSNIDKLFQLISYKIKHIRSFYPIFYDNLRETLKYLNERGYEDAEMYYFKLYGIYMDQNLDNTLIAIVLLYTNNFDPNRQVSNSISNEIHSVNAERINKEISNKEFIDKCMRIIGDYFYEETWHNSAYISYVDKLAEELLNVYLTN